MPSASITSTTVAAKDFAVYWEVSGNPDGKPVVFGEAEKRAAYERLNDQGSDTDVDFVCTA